MDLGLTGRVFIVTGASAGLGFASAQALVDDGAKVVICSRTPARIEAAVAALGAGNARGLALDLADPDAADRLVAEATAAYERLDGAILSVGGPPGGQAKDIDDQQWRVSFETVFLGPLRVARAVLDSGEGKAVTFVLSSSVKSPVAGLGISNALRPGLAGAAKSMAEEYGPTGGRVTMVLPGRLDTDRIKEPRLPGGLLPHGYRGPRRRWSDPQLVTPGPAPPLPARFDDSTGSHQDWLMPGGPWNCVRYRWA